MHNKDKHPAIWAEKEAAEVELAALQAARKVHTDAIKVVQAEINTAVAGLKAEKQRLNVLALVDVDRIRELSTDIARYATAMGAVVASRG